MVSRLLTLLFIAALITACSSGGGNVSGTFTNPDSSGGASSETKADFDLREGSYAMFTSRQGSTTGTGTINQTEYTHTTSGVRNSMMYMSVFEYDEDFFNIEACNLSFIDLDRQQILGPWLDAPYNSCETPEEQWESRDLIGTERNCANDQVQNGELQFLTNSFSPPEFYATLNLDGVEIWNQMDSFCASSRTFSGNEQYVYRSEEITVDPIQKTTIRLSNKPLSGTVDLELILFGLAIDESTTTRQFLPGDYESILDDSSQVLSLIRYQPNKFVAYLSANGRGYEIVSGEVVVNISNGVVEILMSTTTNGGSEFNATIYMDAPRFVEAP